MSELTQRKCEACEGGTLPLASQEIEGYKGQIDPAWEVVDGKGIRRRFKFGDFNAAFGFATRVALLAESEGHHPDFELGWGRVVVDLTTHAAGGLTDNDFIMAAKIDELASA
jgi:4a-hydroxytetrahydrobiopterin dehydratase